MTIAPKDYTRNRVKKSRTAQQWHVMGLCRGTVADGYAIRPASLMWGLSRRWTG